MRSMSFKNSVSDDTPLTQTSSPSEGCTSRPGLTPLEIAVSQWKDVGTRNLIGLPLNLKHV